MLLLSARIPPRPCLRYLTTSAVTLSGHNKWSKIKEGKGANDLAKSRIYGKANRDIVNAVRKGDSADPALNSALATAVAKAKESGVPKANIEAALEQASKQNDTMEKIQLEALVAGQIGLIIQCASDNRNRTLHEMKALLKDHGVQPSAVSFMFERKGKIEVLLDSSQSTDELLMKALDCGALDVTEKGPRDVDNTRIMEVTTSPVNFGTPLKTLRDLGYSIRHAGIAYLPVDIGVEVDEEARQVAVSSIEKIVDHPDVYAVHVSPEL